MHKERAEKPAHGMVGLNAAMGIMFGGVCSSVGVQGQAVGQPRMGGGGHRGSPCVGANFLFFKHFCGERSCTPSYNPTLPTLQGKMPSTECSEFVLLAQSVFWAFF